LLLSYALKPTTRGFAFLSFIGRGNPRSPLPGRFRRPGRQTVPPLNNSTSLPFSFRELFDFFFRFPRCTYPFFGFAFCVGKTHFPLPSRDPRAPGAFFKTARSLISPVCPRSSCPCFSLHRSFGLADRVFFFLSRLHSSGALTSLLFFPFRRSSNPKMIRPGEQFNRDQVVDDVPLFSRREPLATAFRSRVSCSSRPLLNILLPVLGVGTSIRTFSVSS